MALSGVIEMPIESYWKLQIEWRATQNIAGNRSVIRADLYWVATRSDRGRITDNSYEFAELTIGTASTGDDNYVSAALNDGQKKLLLSSTVEVVHDSNGNRSVDIGATFEVNTYLRGTFYSSLSVEEEVDLNPIPRESELSVSADWTAGFQKTLSVRRQSVGFYHRVRFRGLRVDQVYEEVYVMDIPADATSATTNFTAAHNEAFFRILNRRNYTNSQVVLETWSGDTLINSTTTTGILSAPNASFLDAPTSFTVGAGFNVEAKWYQKDVTHTIRLKNGTTVLKEYTGVAGYLTFTTNDISAALAALMPSATTKALTLETLTFYGAQQVRAATTAPITAVAGNGGPVFQGVPTYKDTNAAMVTVTGNDQFIIQNKSTVQVTLPVAARALPNAGSTIREYVATLGGKTVTKPWSNTANVVFEFGTINAFTNQTLVIRAVDTRNRSAIVSKQVNVLAYSLPGISVGANRVSGYQPDTVVSLSGTVSSLKVNSIEKNQILTARVRTKEAAGTLWSGWSSFSVAGFPTFTATDRVLQLNNLVAYHIEVEVTDRLGTTKVMRSIASGKPLIEIDELLNAIGFGDFPKTPNTVMMGMRLVFGANIFQADTGQGEMGGGAIFMNNSDITGINGLWFNDFTSNGGEGLLFPKINAPWGSTDVADYNHLTVRDGVLMIDGKPIAIYGGGETFLWEGGSYLGEAQSGVHTVTPSRRLSQCPNGWILIWSEYTTEGVINAGWQFSFIPKRYGVLSTGGTWLPMAGAGGRPIVKYFYCSDTTLTGHPRNDDSPQSDIVLRYVLPY